MVLFSNLILVPLEKEKKAIFIKYELKKFYYQHTYYQNETPLDANRSGWSSSSLQEKAYSSFLRFFVNPGKVIDLGCGDGSLLKFLVKECPYALIPYGVDFLEQSILIAKKEILPEFSNNFFTGNILNFDIGTFKPNYIIVNPFYVLEEDRKNFIRKSFKALGKNGKLILYEYKGAPGFSAMQKLSETFHMSNPVFFNTDIVSFSIYAKFGGG